jgi:3-phosphoglycerate kinase
MKTFDFSGKNVLIRVDFNVPQDITLKITDNTRIKAALPTIMKVVEGGGKAVLMSHFGPSKRKMGCGTHSCFIGGGSSFSYRKKSSFCQRLYW